MFGPRCMNWAVFVCHSIKGLLCLAISCHNRMLLRNLWIKMVGNLLIFCTHAVTLIADLFNESEECSSDEDGEAMVISSESEEEGHSPCSPFTIL